MKNVRDYLRRISYSGEPRPTLDTLSQLQRSHLLTVPFENLDIHIGRKIIIDNSNQKIVEEGRGGFCYELNSAFCWLLDEIGFKTKIVSARVYNMESKSFGQEFDHLAILVSLDRDYLVDVGFGEFAMSPIALINGFIHHDSRGDLIIEEFMDGNIVVNKIIANEKVPEYIFTTQPRSLDEFSDMCEYHQVSMESHFTQKIIVSLPVDDGRKTISGNVFKITKNNEVVESIIQSESELIKLLKEHYVLELPAYKGSLLSSNAIKM